MVIQITGNVHYTITLDPTVWIFDDRKIDFSEAFTSTETLKDNEEDDLRKAAQIWDREIYQQKLDPPVNKSISTFDKKKILEGTYVMPIHHFLEHAQLKDNASIVTLETIDGPVQISVHDLKQSLLLFAQDGKPIQEQGPVHLYYMDGSNKQTPLKGIQKVVVE
ncbi:hypothetical protein GLW08_02245 [Pontibacillus yanchengensis]|uniref:Uncharacterized protein n=2 Tax=Pontibacillus yanchengensis TaxID=462910 RepID=A0ACC7VDD0_9BACI|nr:hypothetical protein [Pontibacillus yanchengensis]MYL32996.1 hypothetical protein [Pontibacillus yanchengensis]MYL52154.1 hypothetical protein [Pontibacillus yanchengensis]